MKSPLVAVISYRDKTYREVVKNVLDGYLKVRVKHFDVCSQECFDDDRFDLILVNADKFHLNPGRDKRLSAVAKHAGDDRGPVVLMLTKNLSATDFLRNQAYRVTDTIDIGMGIEVLRIALDDFMIRKPSGGASGDNRANYADA